MTVLAIEIADTGLNAAADSGPVGSPSAGYALLERGEVRVGEAARGARRLKPRHVSHRFWDRLDQEAVGRPFPRGLTHADLVYAHLSAYWNDLKSSLRLCLPQTSVLLAVPGAYSESQLSLLLGIARACDIPVTGMVDASLAALDGELAGEAVLHLDVYLQRAVWTVLEAGDQRSRQRVESVEGAGLASFQDASARLLAEQFIRQTRFDPLHGAASEQLLYDQLPTWLEAIRDDGSAVVSMDAKGRAHSAEVDLQQLTSGSEAWFESILAPVPRLLKATVPPHVALSSGAARIPGLAARVADLTGSEPLALPAGAAANGALRRRDVLQAPGTELPLVLSLPELERHG